MLMMMMMKQTETSEVFWTMSLIYLHVVDFVSPFPVTCAVHEWTSKYYIFFDIHQNFMRRNDHEQPWEVSQQVLEFFSGCVCSNEGRGRRRHRTMECARAC